VGTGRGVAVGDGAGRAVAVGVGVCATADEECFAYANAAPAAAASPRNKVVNTMARSLIGIPAFTKKAEANRLVPEKIYGNSDRETPSSSPR
jgi:hypothetical protein